MMTSVRGQKCGHCGNKVNSEVELEKIQWNCHYFLLKVENSPIY